MRRSFLNQSRSLAIVLWFVGMGLSEQCVSKTLGKVPSAWADIKHIVIVTLENGNPDVAFRQPFLNELSKRGAFLADFHAITHPSQPNYIAMIAGSTLGVRSNDNANLDGQHIGDLLEKYGKTWKVYAEDFPGNCFLGATNGMYARKHVPFISFTSVQSDPNKCKNIVPAQEFATDRTNDRLPTYAFYVPNLANDGHDTGMLYADRWLKNTFGPLFDDKELMKHTLFIITFDEDDGYHSNRIYTVFIGAGVQPGTVSDHPYNHFSMLKTIEDIFELGDLGRVDHFAETISDIWKP